MNTWATNPNNPAAQRKLLTPAEVRALLYAPIGGDDSGPATRETGHSTLCDVTHESPPVNYAELKQTASGRCLYCGHPVGQPCICERYGHKH